MKYTVSDYLVDIIQAMESNRIFGVPGDYNLDFLDHIIDRDDIKWTGNANELNAAYMADGYARETGFAAFVTTFGVGELSAINGLAGSIAENVPVLEIVGAPNLGAQQKSEIVHHTFGNGKFHQFIESHKALEIKVAELTMQNPIDKINEVIKYMVKTRKPAYLVLPIDVGQKEISPLFKNEIDSVINQVPDETINEKVLNKLDKLLNQSKHPLVVVGNQVDTLNLSESVANFIQNNNLPFTDLNLGKGAVDESLPQFIGTYNGNYSANSTKQIVDNADLVVLIGAKLSDFVTGVFTHTFDETNTIDINNDYISILGTSDEYMDKYSFTTVINQMVNLKLKHQINFNEFIENDDLLVNDNEPLTQTFYDQAIHNFVQPGETLVAEQGTSFSGLTPFKLKKDNSFIGQPLWGSIGYAFPAAIGSQFANPNKRTILSTGEGSLQLTIQEFGTMARNNLHPVIIVVDNKGFTVERVIHGLHAEYNDVAELNYTEMPSAFGFDKDNYLALDVTTEKELSEALTKARQNEDKLVLIQAHLGATDAPGELAKMGKEISNNNDK